MLVFDLLNVERRQALEGRGLGVRREDMHVTAIVGDNYPVKHTIPALKEPVRAIGHPAGRWLEGHLGYGAAVVAVWHMEHTNVLSILPTP